MRSSCNGPMFAILGLAIWAGPAAAADNSAALRCAALGDDQARLACYDGIFRAADAADAAAMPQATAVSSGKSAAGVSAASTTAGVATASTAAEAAGMATVAGGGAVAAGSSPAPAADPMADFGLTPAQQRSLDPERPAEPRAPESVTGTVAKVGYTASGKMAVTLENGQVWIQIDTGKPRVKGGDAVMIKRGALGSYLLVPPSGMSTRVRRMK